MKDRIVQYPNRYQLAPVAGQTNIYDLTAVPGTVSEPGTPLNKATFLTDETEGLLWLSNVNVNEALYILALPKATDDLKEYLYGNCIGFNLEWRPYEYDVVLKSMEEV